MTNERQRAANRANAAKSTGPQTKAGKAKASRNALRHGLATALCGEPGAVEEIERLAQAIVVEAGRPDLTDYARRVAEAEIDLRRVRRARQTLARLPTAAATSYGLVKSSNSKLFKATLRRLNRRKNPSCEDLAATLLAAGWAPTHLILSKRPQKAAGTLRPSFSNAMNGGRPPAANLPFAISTPPDALCDFIRDCAGRALSGRSTAAVASRAGRHAARAFLSARQFAWLRRRARPVLSSP